VVRLAPEQLLDARELLVGQPERAVERLLDDARQRDDARDPAGRRKGRGVVVVRLEK
jgi:hypothetical protein